MESRPALWTLRLMALHNTDTRQGQVERYGDKGQNSGAGAAWACDALLTHRKTLGTLGSEGARRVVGMLLSPTEEHKGECA